MRIKNVSGVVRSFRHKNGKMSIIGKGEIFESESIGDNIGFEEVKEKQRKPKEDNE